MPTPEMERDADAFALACNATPWKPTISRCEGEILFEWIGPGRHAVASIEGDGLVGYALLVGDRFVSGRVPDCPAGDLPEDLAEYLA